MGLGLLWAGGCVPSAWVHWAIPLLYDSWRLRNVTSGVFWLVRGIVGGWVQDGGMVRNVARGGGWAGVKGARRPEVRLPALEPYGGGELEPDGDYDGLQFRDVDFVGQDGGGARFMDCAR
jgi:hypothetical protein